MSGTSRSGTPRGSAVVGAALALLGLIAATGAEGAGANDGPNAGSPLPGGGTTKDLTVPGQGGVAGTGLGGSTDGSGNGATSGKTSGNTGAAGVPGTGMSVKGPAGQGIDGQGIDGQGITEMPRSTTQGIAPSDGASGGAGKAAGGTGGGMGGSTAGSGAAASGGASGTGGSAGK